jgi:hypothetical protein
MHRSSETIGTIAAALAKGGGFASDAYPASERPFRHVVDGMEPH